MSVEPWYDNGWIISFVSGLVVAAVIAVAAPAFRWLRSLRGPLTKGYLALTFEEDAVVIERVKCRNSGTRIRGSIRSLGVVNTADNWLRWGRKYSAQYRFEGRVHQRVVLATYWGTRGSEILGSFTFRRDPTDELMYGLETRPGAGDSDWISTVAGASSRPCYWLASPKHVKQRDDVLAYLNVVLRVIGPLKSRLNDASFTDDDSIIFKMHGNSFSGLVSALSERSAIPTAPPNSSGHNEPHEESEA